MIKKNQVQTILLTVTLFSMLTLTGCKDEGPELTINSPQNDEVIIKGEDYTILIDAEDNDGSLFSEKGLNHVEYYIDNVQSYTSEVPPYSFTWFTQWVDLGIHTIRVIAYDEGDNKTEETVSVIVNDQPICDITSHDDYDKVYNNVYVTVTGTVSDSYGSIIGVNYFCNNTMIGTAASSPYSISWDASDFALGYQTLKMEAFDEFGTSGEVSITIEISESDLIGTWESDNNYTGYDPTLSKNTTFLRKLFIYGDNTYCDSLRGKPDDQSYYNVYEMESGTWSTDDSETSITFSPVTAKRMDISNPTVLEEYYPGSHQHTVTLTDNNTKWAWKDEDLDPDVDYNMTKSSGKK